MSDDQMTRVNAAVAWHLRHDDMREADWVAFVEWLEADPAHAQIYDSVALDDAALGRVPGLFPAVPDFAVASPLPLRSGGVPRWALAVTSLAAAVVAAVVVPGIMAPAATAYATAQGEMRTVQLADGSSVDLSGGTRIVLGPRTATLETGQALFHIKHDAERPFLVVSGGLTLRDVGTVFDVARDGPRLDVQVAEGAVLFQPDQENKLLRAGAALTARQDAGTLTLSKASVDQVGSWRAGRLSFTADPLAHVGQVVRRMGGYDLAFAPGLSALPFTGTVTLSGTAARDVPRIAHLIGATWRKDGERWTISPPGDAR